MSIDLYANQSYMLARRNKKILNSFGLKTVEDLHMINLIIAKRKYYKRNDTKKGFKDTASVDYLYTLIKYHPNICPCCGDEMKKIYNKNDLKSFSYDRIDNSKGHCVGNLRIRCRECNNSNRP